MIGKSVTTPKPLPLAEVEDILSKRSEQGEFGYEQQKSLEYAKKFAKVSARKAQEMMAELEEMGVEHSVAVKIVDIVPKHAAQLRAIVGNANVSEDKQKKVLDMLSKVRVKHVEASAEAAPAEAAPAAEPEAKKEEAKEAKEEEKKAKKKKEKE